MEDLDGDDGLRVGIDGAVDPTVPSLADELDQLVPPDRAERRRRAGSAALEKAL